MKNLNKKFWSITAIVIGYLFLLVYLLGYLPSIKFIGILLFWAVMFSYIFLITYWLYKKEWQTILGLSQKNINAKIKWKSFGTGLLMALIINTVIWTIRLILKIPFSSPYSEDMTLVGWLWVPYY